MSVQTTKEIGQLAENIAYQYLASNGLKLIERNYRISGGEIDLIMHDGNTTIFVEVRYRKSLKFGNGAESINHTKRSRLIATSLHYLQTHPQYNTAPCRFDVISITSAQDKPEVEWIKDAFQA